MLCIIFENSHIYMFVVCLILYFYRFFIFKRCVLFLFRNGNICILEKKNTLDYQTHEIKEETKEVLNIVTKDATENVTLYVNDPRFYELFLLRGEEGLGEAYVKEYCFTEELEGLIGIVHNICKCPCYKHLIILYKKFESCLYKKMNITRNSYALDKNILDLCQVKEGPIFFTDDKSLDDIFAEDVDRHFVIQDYDFNNTFVGNLYHGKFVCNYQYLKDMIRSKKMKIKHLETSNEYLESWSIKSKEEIIKVSSKEAYNVFHYYISFLRFLFKNDYLVVNHLFCKK